MKNIQIIKEKENPLFNRKEIQASIQAEITPSREEIQKLISEKFSTSIENIKIKKISGKFGSKTFIIIANIYASVKDKDNIEPISKRDIKIEKKSEKQTTEQPAQPVETQEVTTKPSTEIQSEENKKDDKLLTTEKDESEQSEKH